jgi:hypothetical protein
MLDAGGEVATHEGASWRWTPASLPCPPELLTATGPYVSRTKGSSAAGQRNPSGSSVILFLELSNLTRHPEPPPNDVLLKPQRSLSEFPRCAILGRMTGSDQTDRSAWYQSGIILLGVLGFFLAYGVLRYRAGATPKSATFSTMPLTQVWELVVSVGSGYCGFVIGLLVKWRRELARRFPSSAGSSYLLVPFIWCLSMAITLVVVSLSRPRLVRSPPLSYVNVRVGVLLFWAFVVFFFAIADLQLVTSGMQRLSMLGNMALLDEFKAMQTMLRALLAVLGGLASILVLDTGALFNALNASPANSQVPSQQIYIFGSLLVVGLGVLYLPALSAQHRCGEYFVNRLCPLPEMSDDLFLNACDKRKRLEGILDLDAGFFANLESALVLVAPLLGSVFTTFMHK